MFRWPDQCNLRVAHPGRSPQSVQNQWLSRPEQQLQGPRRGYVEAGSLLRHPVCRSIGTTKRHQQWCIVSHVIAPNYDSSAE
jgi:hypothetical protein